MSEMSDEAWAKLSPAERVDDIPRALAAMRKAVQDALLRHKLAGRSIAVWRDGAVHWIPPEEIPVPTATGEPTDGG